MEMTDVLTFWSHLQSPVRILNTTITQMITLNCHSSACIAVVPGWGREYPAGGNPVWDGSVGIPATPARNDCIGHSWVQTIYYLISRFSPSITAYAHDETKLQV